MARFSNWSGAVLILFVTFLSTAGVAEADLINRSFENGTAPGEATVLAPGSTAIEGWTVVGSDISYVGGRWQHAQGLRSIGLPCGGGISQTFETEPDQEYEVRFSMAGDPNTLPAVKTLTVSFGPETRTFTFDTTGRSLKDMGWDARFWIFTAAGMTTTLTFQTPTSGCSTVAVDSVRLTPVEIGVQVRPDHKGHNQHKGKATHD